MDPKLHGGYLNRTAQMPPKQSAASMRPLDTVETCSDSTSTTGRVGIGAV